VKYRGDQPLHFNFNVLKLAFVIHSILNYIEFNIAKNQRQIFVTYTSPSRFKSRSKNILAVATEPFLAEAIANGLVS
jgi:hypothetical protein